jgi:hypothetical protein
MLSVYVTIDQEHLLDPLYAHTLEKRAHYLLIACLKFGRIVHAEKRYGRCAPHSFAVLSYASFLTAS